MEALSEILSELDRGTSGDSLEGPELDFKTEKPDFKATAVDLAEAAVCLANASGGRILLGVTDRPVGGTSFVGTGLDPAALRAKIHELTKPNLTLTITPVVYGGVTLLDIQVPEGLEVYSTSKGVYFKRWKDTCRPMAPQEVARLNDERRGDDWSSGPSGHEVSEVDPIALEVIRDLLRSTSDSARIVLASADDAQLLAGLELVRDDGSLNRAGALLTVRNRKFGPREVAIYQHRKSLSGEVDYSRRWGEPLVIAFAEILDVISARVTTFPLTLRTGQQIVLEDYPLIAVREALANALTHRDYVVDPPVSIIHSPDELSIRSPGPLVTGVTVENFLSRGTKPRYPTLARAFNRLGWVEYLGQGFNRMFRVMASAGRPLPRLDESPEDTTVVLNGQPPDMRVARLVADLPERYREDTNSLLILDTLCRKKSVTAGEISRVIQRDIDVTEEVLRSLTSAEIALIEPTTGTKNRRHPNYRLQGPVLAKLGTALRYYSHPGPTADRKIIEHLKEYGSINSATVQRMLDLDVYASRDILRDLTKRGVIVRTSEQQRGTAVKYGPGPSFPPSAQRNDTQKPDTGVRRPARDSLSTSGAEPDSDVTLF